MIGGGGERVTLRIVAKHADHWNVWGGPKVMAKKGAILDEHCRAVGRDPKTITRSVNMALHITDKKEDVDRLADTIATRMGRHADDARDTCLAGTPDQIGSSSSSSGPRRRAWSSSEPVPAAPRPAPRPRPIHRRDRAGLPVGGPPWRSDLSAILELSEAERLALDSSSPRARLASRRLLLLRRCAKEHVLPADAWRQAPRSSARTPRGQWHKRSIWRVGSSCARRQSAHHPHGRDGKIEVLCDRFESKRLNRPNDVVCRSTGAFYFTDPGCACRSQSGSFRMPRSIALIGAARSPCRRLRVPETGSHFAGRAHPLRRQYAVGAVHPRARDRRRRRDGPTPHLRRHVLRRDRRRARRHEGRRAGPRLLHRAPAAPGLRADGTRLGIIQHSRGPREPGLGGPISGRFLNARTSVYSLRVKVPGQPIPGIASRGDRAMPFSP